MSSLSHNASERKMTTAHLR